MAKAGVGQFWEDIDNPPYITLFNNSISGAYLWRLVKFQRIIESELQSQRRQLSGPNMKRSQNIATYSNRIITHKVFEYLPAKKLEKPDADLEALKQETKILTLKVFQNLVKAHYENFADDPIQSVFKNREKNSRLSDRIDHLMGRKDMLFTGEE